MRLLQNPEQGDGDATSSDIVVEMSDPTSELAASTPRVPGLWHEWAQLEGEMWRRKTELEGELWRRKAELEEWHMKAEIEGDKVGAPVLRCSQSVIREPSRKPQSVSKQGQY